MVWFLKCKWNQLRAAFVSVCLARGERYRVIGERGGPAGMWRLEGGKLAAEIAHLALTLQRGFWAVSAVRSARAGAIGLVLDLKQQQHGGA